MGQRCWRKIHDEETKDKSEMRRKSGRVKPVEGAASCDNGRTKKRSGSESRSGQLMWGARGTFVCVKVRR